MTGNDQIAFYSSVPGYYPPSGSQSPVSLVAYRINSVSGTTVFNKMERLGKGLVWNAVSTTDTPVVFMPLTIGVSAASPLGTWPCATNANPDPSSPPAYETIGPQVFRFEYCYLLKANGSLSITPPSDVSGIAAVVVDIAAIDPKSKVLLNNAQVTSLAGLLGDYTSVLTPAVAQQLAERSQRKYHLAAPGAFRCSTVQTLFFTSRRLLYDSPRNLSKRLVGRWQSTVDANASLPRPAISDIRLYERYFYLSQ